MATTLVSVPLRAAAPVRAGAPLPAPAARRADAPGRGRDATNSPGARPSYASRAATRAPGVTPRRAAPRPIRLTRRGRLASFLASVLALTAVVLAAGQMADASPQALGVEPTVVVVQSGQTLWGIARDVAPDHDPRPVIAQIRDLNDLGTRSIVAGQTLVVPSTR